MLLYEFDLIEKESTYSGSKKSGSWTKKQGSRVSLTLV